MIYPNIHLLEILRICGLLLDADLKPACTKSPIYMHRQHPLLPPHPKSQFTFAAPHSNTANMHMLIWEQTSNKRKSCCFGAGCRMNVIHTNVYQQAVDHLHYCRTSLSSCPACLSASLHVCPPYYSNHHRSARKWKNATVESFMTTWLVTLWSVARRKNDMYGNQVHIAPCVIDIWDDKRDIHTTYCTYITEIHCIRKAYITSK